MSFPWIKYPCVDLKEEDMSIDYKSIGRRIKAARTRLDMTQERLAEQVNLSPSHLSNIETGTTKVSLPTIVKDRKSVV